MEGRAHGGGKKDEGDADGSTGPPEGGLRKGSSRCT